MKKPLLIATLAAFSFLLLASTSSGAAATLVPFHFVTPLEGSATLPECLSPDLVGTVSGTETTDGQVVFLSDGALVHGTDTLVYRVDFPDGRYVVGEATEHFALAFTPRGVVTTTDAIDEPRTIYDASGEPVGTVRIHALSHVTFDDLNGNGQPDEGELTASVDRFFFTCS